MNFGIASPLFYYCFYPPQGCLATLPILPWEVSECPTEIQPHLLKIDELDEEDNQIIVSKEDLMEEGYEQTKRAWTEEEDQLLMKLCSNPNIFF
jgi:hypothetical protein